MSTCTMSFIYVTLNSYILFCVLRVQAFAFAYRLNIFVERKDYRNKISDQGLISGLQLQATPSPMQCSRMCLRYPECKSYFKNGISGECKLMSDILSGAELSEKMSENWHYFLAINTSGCPTDDGYVLDTESHTCFKLIQQNMIPTRAGEYCGQDGGQLLRIRDVRKQSAVATYLSTFNLKRKSPTVDGFRDDINSVWKHSDGIDLQYFNWVTGEPARGKNCVKLHHNFAYRWAAASCSRANYFVCEIPI